jgi:hypothetical protein
MVPFLQRQSVLPIWIEKVLPPDLASSLMGVNFSSNATYLTESHELTAFSLVAKLRKGATRQISHLQNMQGLISATMGEVSALTSQFDI